MNGIEAVEYLAKLTDRVQIFKKDNTDKFWSYKMKLGRRSEFAFDPNTTTKLVLRTDCPVLPMEGLIDVISLKAHSVSTALNRVFSGGAHVARYKVTVESIEALNAILIHLEQYNLGDQLD